MELVARNHSCSVGNALKDAYHQVFLPHGPGISESTDKAMHGAFARKGLAVKESFFADQATLAADEVLNVMQAWFVDHILGADKKYAPYLQPSD